MPLQLPRHSLLPDLQHSRAVLVGCGERGSPRSWGPQEMARHLAEALSSHDATKAFRTAHTRVLVNPEDPVEALDAVRSAARAASDTLLFYYAGDGSRDTAVSLKAVAELMGTSAATRSVVILDGADEYWFKEHTPTSFILAGSSFGPPGDQLVPFTPTLVQALEAGVREGPEHLDLRTLRNAIEAAFHEARYAIEDHWVLGPARLAVRCPFRFRKVALGLNPAFATTDRGGLWRDIDAVEEAYGW